MTRYIVFVKKGDGFVPVKSVEASSQKQAIAAAAEEDGEYAATPTRSWVTLPVAFERKAKIG